MKQSESGKKATRQCWECLKRRLVCDHTLPHCKKCQKYGKECPGYNEQKPLQFVETGKVTSRRRKDCPPKTYTIPSPKADQLPQKEDPSEPLNSSSDNDAAVLVPIDLRSDVTGWELGNEAGWSYMTENHPDSTLWENTCRQAAEVNRLFGLGGRAKIEEVVAKRLHKEAAKMLRSEKEPLRTLERLLWVMHTHDVPTYDYLSNETSDVVQAVHYYNVRIHPEFKASGELAPNPALIFLPLHILHILPSTIHHILVCISLNYFIQCLPSGTDRSAVVTNRSKVYHHRGAAIRALSRYLETDKTRCSDFTITSILMFMSMDLQNPAMADWRSHASGMNRVIDMRGGFKNLMKQAPHLTPALVIYMIIVIIGNTCSPSWNQIDIDNSPSQTVEYVRETHSLIFPYILCPRELFVEVIRTNQLRKKASAAMKLCEIESNHVMEAYDLLARIKAFVPVDWAQPGAYYDEWLLIGTMFQSAVAIYCTMSLQSLTILPNSLEIDTIRSVQGDRLLKSLRAAVNVPRVMKFAVWPLVVSGVEAAYRDEAARNYVDSVLSDLSCVLRTNSPLKARAVLRRYWQKGVPGWDECFDRPETVLVATCMC
ncbi:uncharacterized protein K460DRAFT_304288 [Cucurbitaria berberidis CBS 394.84]|uniref:Zn(2)-C6 fungal-type domain-containing protein n=1 Tax=Cucurbitaria berberidis CBS 394.84 TaxID=1168544 RepID=A0A9P4GNR0_9PLEO|nr:uncharacterized protein K460DRAFT_304288 [Cucurbitaria berberidis CBS 394.84]KAF1848804.1 hypothetical protein K460DRAFT_304288 [Cucurbitaria berberidis CBS 394.84]